MTGPRIGSLFSGYGGLDLGVQAALGGTTAWVSDICRTPTKDNPATHFEPHRSPCRILAHRYPDVPNLGDISTVDWSTAEPVDVLTGGFPCQDVSHAGKRAGMRPDTRTGLWSQMAYAIDQLRPALVVAENVRGLLSAEAHSDLEPCPWCMGDGSAGSPLRALGAVLGDLADIGYDACWYGLRAADVGAAHGRFRVFVVAYPRGEARDVGAGLRADEPTRHGRRQPARDGGTNGDLLPTPTGQDAANTGGPSQHGRNSLPLNAVAALLPTPAVNDMGAAYTPDEWDAWTGRMKAEHGNGNGHGKSLSIEAARLLPTPDTGESLTGHGRRGTSGKGGHQSAANLDALAVADQWGQYADAIARWGHVLGRPAPAPTMTSAKGNPQLAPAFVEWLMGLPAGWVTDVPGITRNEALKALGNGVVPAQAEAAIRFLLASQERAA